MTDAGADWIDGAKRYRRLRVLASGGFGEVLLARQEAFGGSARTVCVKRAHQHDERLAPMFVDEIKLLMRLSHEHIVQTIDAGIDVAGRPFVVMEYVHGTSLDHVIQSHRPNGLAPEHVAYALVGAAEGLAYAHAEAVIHRDIKPANILLGVDGSVKLGDFGIAKVQQSGPFAPTHTGRAIGTTSWMAPEQLAPRGGQFQIDERVDLWALGVVAWEALCGFRPFEDPVKVGPAPDGDARVVWTMRNILEHARRPIYEVRPDAPPALLGLIEGLLHRDFEQRIRSAEHVTHALIGAGLGLPTHRKAFARLLAKDTIPEREGYRPGATSLPPDAARKAVTVQTTPSAPPAAPVPSYPERPATHASPTFIARVRTGRLWMALGAASIVLAGLVTFVGAFLVGGGPAEQVTTTPQSSRSPDAPAERTPPAHEAVVQTTAAGPAPQIATVPSPPAPAEPTSPAAAPEIAAATSEGPARELARITVIAIPRGPIFLDDEQQIGSTRASRASVEVHAGTYRVSAGPGSRRVTRRVTVAPGQHATVELDWMR